MQRKILITGATGGIGLSLLKIYKRHGHIVLAMDLNEDALLKIRTELGEDIHIFPCDVTKGDDLHKTFEAIHERHGLPDIIINNAGIAHVDSFLEEGRQGFDQVMDVNFNAVVHACRFWLPLFTTSSKGKIANMASVAGHVAPAGMSSYAASKFAVVGFTRALSLELKAQKSVVRMVLISPGFVATNIMRIGEEKGFPKELTFLVTTPEKCAENIYRGLESDDDEIFPTINGKAMLLMQRFIPAALAKINLIMSKKALNIH